VKITRVITYYSLFFFALAGTCFAQESVNTLPDTVAREESESSTEMPMADNGLQLFNEVFGANPEALSNMMQELFSQQKIMQMKEEIDARDRSYQSLPENIRQEVDQTVDAYHHVSEFIRLEYTFKTLSESIQQALTQQADFFSGHRAVEYNKLKTLLDSLLVFLRNGSFAQFAMPTLQSQNPYDIKNMLNVKNLLQSQLHVDGGAQAEQPAPAQDEKTFLTDIASIISLLGWYDQCLEQLVAEQLTIEAKDALHLQISNVCRLLRMVLVHDSKGLCSECIAMVHPSIDAVRSKINHVLMVLTNARLHVDQNTDVVLKGAYAFWIKQFTVYQQTIDAFIDLSHKAQIDLSVAIRYMSYFHEITDAFLFAESRDCWADKTKNFVEWALIPANIFDAFFRGAIFSLGYSHFAGEGARLEVQKYLLGKGTLAEFVNPLNDDIHRLYSLLTTIPFFFSPNSISGRIHPVMRVIGRALCATALMRFGIGNNVAKEGNNSHNDFWHPANKYVKIAFAATVKELQFFLSAYLKNKLKTSVDALTLEQMEDASIGLIKPELVDLALNLVISSVLTGSGNVASGIAQLDTQDIIRYDFFFVQKIASIEKEKKCTLDDATKQKLYIKYLLVGYVCQNMGEFWGRVVAEMFKKQLAAALSWVLKNVWLLLTEEDTTEAMSDVDQEILSMINGGKNNMMAPNDLKWIFNELFQVQSPIRWIAINFLKSYGLLDMSVSDTNPTEVNYRLVSLILYFLTDLPSARVLTHSQAAELLHAYESKYENNIGPFIDLIFEKITERTTTAIGGWLGYFIGARVANSIVF
jgi:hypothetical protein